MAYLELKNIDKKFGDKVILNDLNMEIEKGELISLLGSSGSGKSTILRIISGLEPIDEGQIFINGQEVTNLSIRKRNIGMIFQNYTLFPTMTVYDNVAYSLKLKKKSKAEVQEKVAWALETVAMLGHENKFPSQLSGGEQQRVSIARVIVNETDILLLDEPFSAIDAKLRKELQVKIREIHEKLNLTTIFVTHDQEEAMSISDRIFLLESGRIIQQGSPNDLYQNPNSLYTASFMGNHNIINEDGVIKAIKAESIEILGSDISEREEDTRYLSGRIEGRFIKGSTVEFTVSTEEGMFKVDLLNTPKYSFEEKQKVQLAIPKDKIISLTT